MYYIYDNFVATSGQCEFILSKPFIKGTILVYLNGLLQSKGEDRDYNEIDNIKIKFNYPLDEGDNVTIVSLLVDPSINIDIISNNSYNNNSIFQKYGDTQNLLYNQRYDVNIDIKNYPIEWSFTSKYSPLYSNVKKIRMDTGDLLSNLNDDQINFIIYQNSKEAELIFLNDDNYLSDDETALIKKYITQWVRYKTDLDLTYAIYLTLTNQYGSIKKTIGEINIEKNIKLPDIEDMLSRFKELLKQYESYLNKTGDGTVKTFVKASSLYSYNQRGVF